LVFEGSNAISLSLNTNTTLKYLIIGSEPGEEKLAALARLIGLKKSKPKNEEEKEDVEIKKEEGEEIKKEEEKGDEEIISEEEKEEELIISEEEKEVEEEQDNEKIEEEKKNTVFCWFKTIKLTPNDQEECANLFIEKGYDDLDTISRMTDEDIDFIKEKFISKPGNYKKISFALQKLNNKALFDSSSPTSIHPWHIEPSVKKKGTLINKTNTLNFLNLSLTTTNPLLLSTFNQFKSILTSLHGSLDKIKSIHIVQSSNLENMFQSSLDVHLRSLLDAPEVFKNEIWREGTDPGVPWREAIHNKFFNYALQFPNNQNRERGLVVIPAVTGYPNMENAIKICNNGPKSLGSTDAGYFGRGLYFSTHINYAKKYGKFLVVFWVFIGNLYPVIEFPHPPVGTPKFYDKIHHSQKPTLCGKPQKSDSYGEYPQKKTVTYDTHYTVVRPFTEEGENPHTTMKFVPCEVEKMNNENVFDEVVVFQESHVLPMYLIQLK